MKVLPNFLVGRPETAEFDFSGIVVDGNGTGWRNGDAVFGVVPPGLCRKSREGALSEYTVVPSSHISSRPANTTPVQAAGIAAVGLTAYQCLFDVAGLEEVCQGRWVKVMASASERNRTYVMELGADEITELLTSPWSSHATRPKFNVILDAVGLADDSLYAKSETYLAPGGVFISVGPQPTGWVDVPKLMKLMFHLIQPDWLGGIKRRWIWVSGQPRKDTIDAVQKFVADGKVKPVIDSVYAFEDVFQAYDRIMSERATGKVVVKVDPDVE
ncbi:hypothetical protein EW146_g3376 [Bondarzewia mesenterica]|uniref:Enoyl reductase (ER) domain-containing protein n=1 Tax=Bondarzewia mesenterica TaxID=1095465 RepID=A0A4S4LZ72_9AGAM|nr:hypothetical protein EW146_g3376 [Bondarzewia mesenterica]